jgi:hypothetical protein
MRWPEHRRGVATLREGFVDGHGSAHPSAIPPKMRRGRRLKFSLAGGDWFYVADMCDRQMVVLKRRQRMDRLHVRKATKSPLRFASVCFPPASLAFARGGKQKKTPKDPSEPLIC